ncbi:integrase, catalytic region, zinc finger, CCHC-type containing protein [Tanacetum coccineum]
MQGTELSYPKRECKLYNEFDKFTSIKGESLHEYYLRSAQLINDMHTIRMTMQQVQPQISHPTPSVPQNAYHSPLISQQPPVEFPQINSGLAVPVFLLGDDPISCLNKAMSFMSTDVDGRFTIQQVQGRRGQGFAVTRTQGNATSLRENNATNKASVVKCYNCQGEGHMERQCTQPKRPMNSTWFKEKMLLKELFLDNDRLLGQIISQDIVLTVVNSFVVIDDSKKSDKSFVDIYNKCLKLEAELVKRNDVFIDLSKWFSNLEQHRISLEVAMQLNQEIFQKGKSRDNQNDPEFQEYFEKNDLKAQLHAKDTTISNLKKQIHSLNAKFNQATVKKEIDEYETINIELEHIVAKLLRENEQLHIEREHLKKTYKELYDSIKKTHVQTKDQCDSLIAQLNQKSIENADLNAQIWEKVFAITALM